MKRFTLIKKASPVNYALESTRTLDNGVVLRLIHCGDTLTVTAAYEKQLESFTDLRSVEEAAYIEDYLTRKYSGVDAADLPLLTAYVGLSMMCYTMGKEKRTALGDFQLSGRMGKLLYCLCRTASCLAKSSKE